MCVKNFKFRKLFHFFEDFFHFNSWLSFQRLCRLLLLVDAVLSAIVIAVCQLLINKYNIYAYNLVDIVAYNKQLCALAMKLLHLRTFFTLCKNLTGCSKTMKCFETYMTCTGLWRREWHTHFYSLITIILFSFSSFQWQRWQHQY